MPELTNLCRNSPELRSRVPFTAPRAILMGLGTQACSHMASSAPSCHTISRSCSITSRQEHPSAGFLQWVSEAVRWCQSFLRLHVNRWKWGEYLCSKRSSPGFRCSTPGLSEKTLETEAESGDPLLNVPSGRVWRDQV
nr:uncharacterized protein LOC105710662 isoform X3 [Aotus nancymaae]